MNMIGKIRRLRFRDGLTISEICRKTGISRNTVKKWLNAADDTEPKYQRKAKPTLLTPYEERLKGWLETDSRRPKRDRRTGLALFAKLQQEGFTGSYTRVTEYIRRWRDSGGAVAKSAFVPLKFELGEAFQFDWSEESLVIGGIWRKLLVAHTKLCASKAFLLVAYPTQSHEMLFDAHTRAFRVFGGIPKRGIYDNMKTVGTEPAGGQTGSADISPVCGVGIEYEVGPGIASGWRDVKILDDAGRENPARQADRQEPHLQDADQSHLPGRDWP